MWRTIDMGAMLSSHIHTRRKTAAGSVFSASGMVQGPSVQAFTAVRERTNSAKYKCHIHVCMYVAVFNVPFGYWFG